MITVKEEFLVDPKTQLAIKKGGYQVVVLWLSMKAFAAAKLTNGFVPDEMIEHLPGAPSRARKALDALVNCGLLQADGTRGSGLVDRVEHGWQLHDEDQSRPQTGGQPR